MENKIIQSTKKEFLKCPKCLLELKNINNNMRIERYELKDFCCDNCGKFTFILCQFCNKKIFFQKNINVLPLNGMNGINIECPYSSCGKIFFLTICPKCKKCQKIPKLIKEGELIKCSYIKNCGYEYLQVRCPKKDCNDVNYFSRPKNFCNSPNGILYNHKSKLIFQKISCNYCLRPIVYISEENKINRYYDSMIVTCPYESCGKIFNRIICPMCSQVNIIDNGFYFMGHRIKCIGCKNYFGKILCPKCLKVNPLQKHFFKTGEILCRFSSNAERSNIMNCIYCRRINVFNQISPIPGQQITCGYKDCGKIFNEVYCPACDELNPFPNGDFTFGKTYKCLYSFCKKIFQFFVCPNCMTYSRILDAVEGKKYICNNCKVLIGNWGCPFCNKTIMDKNSSLKYGQMTRCPYCQKEYSFCRCYECKKLIFSKERQNILGLSVQCKSCAKILVNTICPKCSTKITFLDRINDLEDGEKIKCNKCNEEFEYKKSSQDMIDDSDIYYENLSILQNIKGEPINFGEGRIDENYLLIENLLIKSQLYLDNLDNSENKKTNNDNNSNEIIIKRNSKLCLICHGNYKESIFYPCGHRCTCYKCAVYFFEVFKKCPKCNKDAETIIPKIYE